MQQMRFGELLLIFAGIFIISALRRLRVLPPPAAARYDGRLPWPVKMPLSQYRKMPPKTHSAMTSVVAAAVSSLACLAYAALNKPRHETAAMRTRGARSVRPYRRPLPGDASA